MFDAVKLAIREYIIRQLAEMVAADIAETGLTVEDQAAIDRVL